MYRIITGCAALCSLVLILPIPAHATPTIIYDAAFIDNRPADDIYGVSGLRLQLSVSAIDTGGTSALTGSGSSHTATSSNPSFPFGQPISLSVATNFFAIGRVDFGRVRSITPSQLPQVTGIYTFTITNTSSESAVSTSHNLDKPEIIPIPTNLAFSDNSTTPVFTFIDPDPTPHITGLVRRYQVQIFDNTEVNVFESGMELTPSFAVPSGILEMGMDYYFRACSLDIDITEASGTIHNPLENRAVEYSTFQPVPEPSPPEAICQDMTVAAGANCTANASIDNGSYDPDGDPITLTQSPTGPYPLGDTLVTLTVTDSTGASSQCLGTVTVVDNTPPTITGISVNPSVLWPPYHQMVPVSASVSASDNCDPDAFCKIVAVSSNEPENGLGDGDTSPDWQMTGDLTVNLRAERSGAGTGRVYTITVECTDDSGNSSTSSAVVTVPHNR